jgi:hypothetical protein
MIASLIAVCMSFFCDEHVVLVHLGEPLPPSSQLPSFPKLPDLINGNFFFDWSL